MATALGGVVGIVEPHHLGGPGHVGGYGIQFRQPPVALVQGHYVTLRSGEHSADAIDRISRVGHQGDVAGVQEAEGGMADALLGPDQGENLGVGVELDAEAIVVPFGYGPAHLRQSVGLGVAVVGRILRCRQQTVDDGLRRGNVRVADAEGHHVGPGGPLGRDDAGDLHEGIGRQFPQTFRKVHPCGLNRRLMSISGRLSGFYPGLYYRCDATSLQDSNGR